MKRMGVEFTFVSPDCTDEELNAAFKPNTKADLAKRYRILLSAFLISSVSRQRRMRTVYR